MLAVAGLLTNTALVLQHSSIFFNISMHSSLSPSICCLSSATLVGLLKQATCSWFVQYAARS